MVRIGKGGYLNVPYDTRINAYQNSFFPRTITTWKNVTKILHCLCEFGCFQIDNPTRSTCAILCIEGLDLVKCIYMLVVRLF